MRAIAAVLAALALAACGGDQAGLSDEEVVRAWADELRRGDVAAASERFAPMAEVSNGTPVVRLRTPAAVRAFNASLPCGARVVGTRRAHGLIIADFVLTERPGGNCGSGTGGSATTAFEIRDGRIVRWLRLPEEETAPEQPSGPLV
jgi:limonene-1,2-epoxide hydrolase